MRGPKIQKGKLQTPKRKKKKSERLTNKECFHGWIKVEKVGTMAKENTPIPIQNSPSLILGEEKGNP